MGEGFFSPRGLAATEFRDTRPMCGRVVVKALKGMIAERVRGGGPPGLIPHFNVAPTGMLPTIHAGWEASERRWGLIPSWAKDSVIASKTFNARAETVATLPSFRSAFKARRCLIPVEGFYEWAAVGKAKVPFFISNTDPGEMLVFAGLWERWKDLETCTIITTEANGFMQDLHSRMPAILQPDAWAAWIDPKTPQAHLLAALQPAPDDLLQAWEVHPLRGDGPELIERV